MEAAPRQNEYIEIFPDMPDIIEHQSNLSKSKDLSCIIGNGGEKVSEMEISGDYYLVKDSQQLQQAEIPLTHTQNILESITDAFFILDHHWQFTYLNPSAEKILFSRCHQLIGANIWAEFPEFANSPWETQCKRCLSQQVTTLFELFYPSVGIWWEVRVSPYTEGLLVYCQNITQNKQIEKLMLERSHLSTLEAEVSIALRDGTNLTISLQQCTESMLKHLNAVWAAIWTYNPQANLLQLETLAHHSGDASPDLELLAHRRLPLDGSLIGFVAQTRQPYLTQDSTHPSRYGLEARLYNQQLAESCSLIPDYYIAAYPMLTEERLIGVIAIGKSEFFSDTVDGTLSTLSNNISIGIDRFWAKTALMGRWEALLFRLANQIRNSLDLDTILGTAVNEIQTLLKLDRCHFVWCWPHPTHPSVSVTHEALARTDLPTMMENYSLEQMATVANKISQLQMLRIDDVAEDALADEYTQNGISLTALCSLNISAVLLVPLKTRAGQLGAIVGSHCTGSRSWSDSEVELLQAVVDQLAIAIDQAELFAQTRAAAFAAQTQAKQLELALQELKQTESRLIQTEKMSSLGQMVAGIAHEINNPVNFITGNLTHTGNYVQDILALLELYQECYPNPDPRIQEQSEEIDLEFLLEDLPKMLISMKMGADRIRQIVVSLRNFSRLDESEKKPVDIHEGIDNTLLILQHRLKPSGNNPGIEIIKEYGDLPLVDCYAGQLNQVFMNIISNGIDALENESSPKTITITTEVVKEESVIIHIRDNGSGMSENVKKRLFDPFFTTKPVGKGTGLGLSISYQIVVEKHRGILKCLSELGKGSEFWIEIPIC